MSRSPVVDPTEGPHASEAPPFRLVDRAADLPDALAGLADSAVVYLDTEFDSTRDGTTLSVIQVSAGGEVLLIDALKISDLSPLRAILGRPGCTWVLHAGQQDTALLTARLGIRPTRVFDTQVAWALVTVEYSPSLAYLKYRLLGIRGEKPHQTDDWSRRPLPATQLAYAADDVAHLPRIHRALLDRCGELSRVDAVLEASLETPSNTPEPASPLTLEAFRNAWQLERTGQAVLRFLIDWYNGLPAAERAFAPDQKGLLAIASRRPRSLDELGGLRAVPRRTVSQHGRALLAGVRQAVESAEHGEFVAIEPPPYATAAEILAQGWLEAVRAEVCVTLAIAPELAFPARLVRRMRELAVAEGSLEGALGALRGWRRELLEAEFRARIARFGALDAFPAGR